LCFQLWIYGHDCLIKANVKITRRGRRWMAESRRLAGSASAAARERRGKRGDREAGATCQTNM
jgi:hypothetical protein